MTIAFSKTLANAMWGFTGGTNFRTLMNGGFLTVYSGTRPASPEAAETGNMLLNITSDGVDGLLRFQTAGDISDGVIAKLETEAWDGTVSNSGAATWFRFYGPDHVTGASTIGFCFDGTVGVDLLLPTSSLVQGDPSTVDIFSLALNVG